MAIKKLIIGSRDSELAMWQTKFVERELKRLYPEIEIEIKAIKTKGDIILNVSLDKIEGKGLFTKELENELLSRNVDFAVHSLKDMPTEVPEGLMLSAILKRHDSEDAFVARKKGMTIRDLPQNATIATGSTRRRAQLLIARPDLNIVDLRGNVPTRLRKFKESNWDGIILARAGLERLGLEDNISSIIPRSMMIPAVGQGAMCIESRIDNEEVNELLAELNHQPTFLAVTAERAMLNALGGGCKTPIAGYAELIGDDLHLEGLVASPDGKEFIKADSKAPAYDAKKLGEDVAEELLINGAREILDKFEKEH